MDPQKQPRGDQFTPKWRHFHPQSTIWVENILDHDVVFQVADEHNNTYTYRLPEKVISELPGGAIATLGLKKIIDELIQNNSEDALRIWDATVRAKYEEDVIVKIKDAPLEGRQTNQQGEINLAMPEAKPDEEEEKPQPKTAVKEDAQADKEEEAFPDLTKPAQPVKTAVKQPSKDRNKGKPISDKIADPLAGLPGIQTIEE